MIVLALESSTQLGGVAVIKDGHVVAEESSLRQQSHSENMNVFIENCLDRSGITLKEIDLFAVGRGPGSFTGIRVAANIGKTFAYLYQKPMVAVNSLELLATPIDTKIPVVTMINAYKNMVYFGMYDRPRGVDLVEIHSPRAVPVKNLGDYLDQKVVVVGDGYAAFKDYFSDSVKQNILRDPKNLDYPTAGTLGVVAERLAKNNQTIDWNSLTPLYIRASEAEENKRGIVITPLK